MKAIVPVAGAGRLLRPHTYTQPKPLIPVAGKPILGHIIENLLSVGIRELTFVVGYLKEKIQEYVITHYAHRVNATFVEQTPRKGLAHALWVCREQLENTDEILVVLGDTIFDQATREIMEIPGTVLAVHEVSNPREFGIAMVSEHGRVIEVKEKPEIPTSNLALAGLYKIDHIPILLRILEDMMTKPIQDDEEYSLPDALMHMIQTGIEVRAHRAENWFDCGKKQTLLEANQVLLQKTKQQTLPSFENTLFIPPVYIAENCHIENAIIGPNVAIGESASIRYSIIQNSILGAFSTLNNVTLTDSIVGNDATLMGQATSVNLGDNTEIDLGK